MKGFRAYNQGQC